MSVKIRLSKTGTTNAPSYRIIAVDSHKKRDGKALEILGSYNPRSKKFDYLKVKEIENWVSKGAQISETVKKLKRSYTKLNQEVK